MKEISFDTQVSTIVDQLTERFNMAIAIAVDDSKTFEESESVFQELISVLEYYRCDDVAAEQLMNYSKVAFFRKKYMKALNYAVDAVEKCSSSDKASVMSENLHSMAYKLLEKLLINEEDEVTEINFEDIESFLDAEDYCNALIHICEALKNAKVKEEKEFLINVLKKHSLEVMRQGLRYEKKGYVNDAVKLFKATLPYLNPKRAEVIKNEIRKLEVM